MGKGINLRFCDKYDESVDLLCFIFQLWMIDMVDILHQSIGAASFPLQRLPWIIDRA
jgi:hypothetical protein